MPRLRTRGGILIGATYGGVGGAGVGAAVGAMAPGQRWDDTSLEPEEERDRLADPVADGF